MFSSPWRRTFVETSVDGTSIVWLIREFARRRDVRAACARATALRGSAAHSKRPGRPSPVGASTLQNNSDDSAAHYGVRMS
jgi:hypothetical protein